MLKSARRKKLSNENTGNKSVMQAARELKNEYGANSFISEKLLLSSNKHRKGVRVRRKTAEREENRGFPIRSSESRDSRNIVSVISRTKRLKIRNFLLFSPFNSKERISSMTPSDIMEINRTDGHL